MTHAIAVNGIWDEGYVLDKYVETSEYVGEDAFGHPMFHTIKRGRKRCPHEKPRFYRGFLLSIRAFFKMQNHRCKKAFFPLRRDLNSNQT